MKILLHLFALAALAGGTHSAHAEICVINDAAVAGIFQWDDGNIFIEFDRNIGCGCFEGNRAAFHKDDNQKFMIAAALTAISTGRRVSLRADNGGGTCPVHGNTPKLIMLRIQGG